MIETKRGEEQAKNPGKRLLKRETII